MKSKIKTEDQIYFIKKIASFLSVGIPLTDALLLAKKPFVHSIHEHVLSGQTFSDALTHKRSFHPLIIQMARIGELSGSLSDALSHAVSLLESSRTQKRKIISSMIYPIFIAVTTLLISAFLVFFIFPKITPLFISMNIPLPFLTRLLIYSNALFLHHWLAFLLSLVVCVSSGIFSWKKYTFVKSYFIHLLLIFPGVGDIVRGTIIGNIFYSLHVLMSHGESLPHTISIVAELTPEGRYRDILIDAKKYIHDGGSLSTYFERLSVSIRYKRYIPVLVADMLHTGEQIGGFTSSCRHIADIYTSDTNDTLQKISQFIEPVLMLFMGITVGSIALSIILPIYEITNHLSK